MVSGEMCSTKPHFDRFASQQAKGPMVVPVRDGTAGDGDEVGLLRAAQGLAIADLTLVAHHGIYAAFREAGTDSHDGVTTDVEGATHFVQAPAFSQFEQDLSTGTRAGTLMARMDKCLQARAGDFREYDLVAGLDVGP
jgi:hypothetical protein